MAQKKNYYEMLGLKRDASVEEIQSAWLKLNNHTVDQESKEAFETLSDVAKKEEYDELLNSHFDPTDLYPIEDISHLEEVPKPKTLKDRLWSVAKVILIIVVTGGLLYYVFSKVPFALIKSRMINSDKAWTAAAMACYFTSIIFASWRLLSFFKSIGLKLNYRLNLRLYFLGLCYNLLLPGGIGGDGYKIYLLHKRFKVPTKKAFFAIFFDRLSGLWAIGLIAVALTILVPSININLLIPIGVFAGGTLIYYGVVYKFFHDFTSNFIQAHLKAVLVQFFQVLAIVCLLVGQNFHAKFSPYLLSFLVSSLAAILPSIGGGGVREAIFINLSKPLSLLQDLALYLSFSFYLISIAIALFGIYYAVRVDKLEDGLEPLAPQKK